MRDDRVRQFTWRTFKVTTHRVMPIEPQGALLQRPGKRPDFAAAFRLRFPQEPPELRRR